MTSHWPAGAGTRAVAASPARSWSTRSPARRPRRGEPGRGRRRGPRRGRRRQDDGGRADALHGPRGRPAGLLAGRGRGRAGPGNPRRTRCPPRADRAGGCPGRPLDGPDPGRDRRRSGRLAGQQPGRHTDHGAGDRRRHALACCGAAWGRAGLRGTFLSALEMAGVSLSVLRVDDGGSPGWTPPDARPAWPCSAPAAPARTGRAAPAAPAPAAPGMPPRSANQPGQGRGGRGRGERS